MKLLLFLTGIFLSLASSAIGELPPEFSQKKNQELKLALMNHLSQQKVLSYKEARRVMFGDLYLEKDGSSYYVEDTYCEERFDSSVGVGPDRIPNHTKINCEHTWPQSRFNPRYSNSAQKSDLHHLFPVKAVANSTRGNIPFGEVQGTTVRDCDASFRGDDVIGNYESFEPPKYHKGNVARALFYFATRYNLDIDSAEEKHLRAWHRLDPVDDFERERNEKIFKIQGNRNPFIDDESLIDRIDNI